MSLSHAIVALSCVSLVLGDVYMHMPRGSNNRLNERSANRNNGNRVFDSQNNNRGGYNKGDVDDEAAGNDASKQYDMAYYMSDDPKIGTGNSYLNIEWTNQHGCGGNEQGDPHKLNCQIVIQYMCHHVAESTLDNTASGTDPNFGPVDGFRTSCNKECMVPRPENPTCEYPRVKGETFQSPQMTAPQVADRTVPPCTLTEISTSTACVQKGFLWVDAQVNDMFNCPHKCVNGQSSTPGQPCQQQALQYDDGGPFRRLRDGTTTNRQEFTNPNNNNLNEAARADRKQGDVEEDRAMHESWEWYDECYRRERNRGLFTADQNLRNNALGYSSAVYTRQNPNNNRRGYECPEERDYYPYWHPSPWTDIAIMTDRLDQCDFYRQESQNVKSKGLCRNTAECGNCIRYNQKATCEENGGRWVEVGSWNKETVQCLQAPWSRVNQLGNGRYGQANTFNWTIPFLDSTGDQKCVVRLRYNISTDDYDAYRVNASFNQNNGQGIQSPVQQNPAVDVGAVATAFRLAINTAQFGRTFQDRSHVLTFKNRPISAVARNNQPLFANKDLYNLGVRGKRCNIVQCFPSVEYDFMPNHLHIKEGDLVHIQWTGSNTHNNGNPAGDGQAGDAGEGTRGTDRHNLVELRSGREADFGGSFPAPFEENTLFKGLLNAYSPEDNVQQYDSTMSWEKIKENWAVRMATANFYLGYDEATQTYKHNCAHLPRGEDCDDASTLSVLLNNAPASFPGGVMQFSKGTYNYMNTRNHNFSNRDQKGHLVVE